MEQLLRALWLLFAVAFALTVALWRSHMGPAIWIKRECGKARALNSDSARQELVRRVQQLVPQASSQNVVFSLQEEVSHLRRVTTYTYYYKVFVADGDCLWVLPFSYDKKTGKYDLGQPAALTQDLIQNVTMAGKPGKRLSVTFRLKPELGSEAVVMVLEPLAFRKNKFYPFDFFQEEACGKAMAVTEKLALSACKMTAEDLEKTRLEDECGNYATGAGTCGSCGIIAASVSGSLPGTLVFFAGALAFFGVMLAKKQVPKISLVIVILEAVAAYFLMKIA